MIPIGEDGRMGLVLMLPLTSVEGMTFFESLPGVAVHPLPTYWLCKRLERASAGRPGVGCSNTQLALEAPDRPLGKNLTP
jgi:hypothetical protein